MHIELPHMTQICRTADPCMIQVVCHRRRSHMRFDAVGHLAIALAGSLYLIAALFGYLTFGQSVEKDLCECISGM